MENHFNTPAEVIEINMKCNESKANLPLGKMILLGILAGMFIALGGAASNTAVHNMENVGLARMLSGMIFPVGLMMIVLVGGELFTGNCLMIMDVWAKRVTVKKLVRNLAVVYFSNLAGALFVDFLIFYSGNLNYSEGLLGAYTIRAAIGKVEMTPVQAMTSAILCNICVCVAILMAAAAKDIAGKVLAIFFPIWAFVIGGFEHCIANMFYIPLGIIAAGNSDYADKAQEIYGITEMQLHRLQTADSLRNFIPVTIGNILGGMLVVGGLCYCIYKKS